MKKKILVMALVVCASLLAGCTPPTNVEESEEGNTVEYLSITSFSDSEQMLEYFSKQAQSQNSDTSSVNLFTFNESFAGLNFDSIDLSGANLYYNYIPVAGKAQKEQGELKDTMSIAPSEDFVVSSEPDDYSNELQRQRDEGTYIPDDSTFFFDDISIGWDYGGNGDYILEKFVSKNSDRVKELPDYPGFYYSDCVSAKGTLYGKSLYWVQDGCYFHTSIPIDLFEEALAELTASTPVMQRIQIGDVTE